MEKNTEPLNEIFRVSPAEPLVANPVPSGMIFDFAGNTTPKEKLAEWIAGRSCRPEIRPFCFSILRPDSPESGDVVVNMTLLSGSRYSVRVENKSMTSLNVGFSQTYRAESLDDAVRWIVMSFGVWENCCGPRK